MLNKKITTTMLALLCVCSMALAAVAPVVNADETIVEARCDDEIYEECI